MRRLLVTVALSAFLAVAGCSSTPARPAPSAAPPDTKAEQVLAAALAKTTGVNLKVEISTSTGDDFLGDYDSANHMATLQQAPGGAGVVITVTPTDYYLSGPKVPKGEVWHLTIAKLRDESSQTLLTDAVVPLTLLGGAVSVVSTRPGSFTGHIDATRLKATTPGTEKFLAHVVKAGGTGAQSLVFLATVDQNGYLTSFKTTFPSLVGGADVVYSQRLSNFGAAVHVQIPAGSKVVTAPDQAYAIV